MTLFLRSKIIVLIMWSDKNLDDVNYADIKMLKDNKIEESKILNCKVVLSVFSIT